MSIKGAKYLDWILFHGFPSGILLDIFVLNERIIYGILGPFTTENEVPLVILDLVTYHFAFRILHFILINQTL